MAQYLDFTGLQTLWGRIKEYAKITTTSGTTKVVIGSNEVTIPDGISPYDSAPEMDGTASAGNSNLFARGNHVHPKDTTKADKATTLSGYGITDANINNGVITLGSNTITPLTSSAIGAASGVCPLNASSKIDSTYLPGYVDDVVEAYPVGTELAAGWLSETSGGSALTPETGKIYVLLSASTNYAVNSEFRWGGSTYVQLNDGGLAPMTTTEIENATPLT